MTTYNWSSPDYVTTDAQFRQVGSELSAALAAVGLIQTADTGQINWTTVLCPASNTDAGYEVWRFNDALQGTAPIFVKLVYGRTNGGNALQLKVSIGTGSNGAGTLTGAGSTISQASMCRTSGVSVGVSFTSFISMVGGKLSLAWKTTAGGSGFLFIHRTNDATGADTADGVFLGHTPSGTGSTAFTASSVLFASGGSVHYQQVVGFNVLRVGNIASSLIGSDYQAHLIWSTKPAPYPLIGICGTIAGEAAHGTTFSTTLFGSTAHTYLSLNDETHHVGDSLKPAMLWE